MDPNRWHRTTACTKSEVSGRKGDADEPASVMVNHQSKAVDRVIEYMNEVNESQSPLAATVSIFPLTEESRVWTARGNQGKYDQG